MSSVYVPFFASLFRICEATTLPAASSTATPFADGAGSCTSTLTLPERSQASGLKTSTGTPAVTRVSMSSARRSIALAEISLVAQRTSS